MFYSEMVTKFER